jgi:hypothetical protein
MKNLYPEQLLNELVSIEAFAEQLRQRCYNARKSLERVYAPASKGKKRKAQPSAATLQVLAKRRATVIRSIG